MSDSNNEIKNKDEKAERIARIQCPHCSKKIHAFRTKKGRILVTTTGGLVLAGVGGTIGASIGIATGGWAAPATIPMGVAGAVLGMGLGYLVGDNLDNAYCPSCGETINLGIM